MEQQRLGLIPSTTKKTVDQKASETAAFAAFRNQTIMSQPPNVLTIFTLWLPSRRPADLHSFFIISEANDDEPRFHEVNWFNKATGSIYFGSQKNNTKLRFPNARELLSRVFEKEVVEAVFDFLESLPVDEMTPIVPSNDPKKVSQTIQRKAFGGKFSTNNARHYAETVIADRLTSAKDKTLLNSWLGHTADTAQRHYQDS